MEDSTLKYEIQRAIYLELAAFLLRPFNGRGSEVIVGFVSTVGWIEIWASRVLSICSADEKVISEAATSGLVSAAERVVSATEGVAPLTNPSSFELTVSLEIAGFTPSRSN